MTSGSLSFPDSRQTYKRCPLVLHYSQKTFFPSVRVCVYIYILNKNLTFTYVYRTRIRHKTILVVCCLHHIRQNVTLFCVHIGALLALSQCTLEVVGTLCFCWRSVFLSGRKRFGFVVVLPITADRIVM